MWWDHFCFHIWYRCEVIIKDNMILWADMSSGWVVDKCNTSGMKRRVSNIVYLLVLLLTYRAHTHKACSSDLVYLVTRKPFTLLLGCEWTYVGTVHSLSHQAMTQASDQLHTTSFCSPPVSGNTRNTRNTRDARSLSLLVHV
jgi:hypothetical protein